MIWGSQYDAMMNWMAKNGKKVGTNNSSIYNNTAITGNKSEDIVNNVYDLYGCHFEWTLEACYTFSRAYRGGHYNDPYSPAHRTSNSPDSAYSGNSSRAALYVK